MEQYCFLFGHADAPETLLPLIRQAVERYYTQYGIRRFVVGHYGSFDRLAGQAVKEMKQQLQDITLQLLLPYHPAERNVLLPPGFDSSLYPDGMERVPRKLAILRANRFMIDRAACVICYVCYPGNAAAMLEYARKKAVVVTNLSVPAGSSDPTKYTAGRSSRP